MVKVTLDAESRIIIPGEMQSTLGLTPGDGLFLVPDLEDHVLHVTKRLSAFDGLVDFAEHAMASGDSRPLRTVAAHLGLALDEPRERYPVCVLPQVAEFLAAIRYHRPEAARQVLMTISNLEENARLGYRLPGSLRGTRSYRFKAESGQGWRMLYAVFDDSKICIMLFIGAHDNVHKTAAWYWDSVREKTYGKDRTQENTESD